MLEQGLIRALVMVVSVFCAVCLLLYKEFDGSLDRAAIYLLLARLNYVSRYTHTVLLGTFIQPNNNTRVYMTNTLAYLTECCSHRIVCCRGWWIFYWLHEGLSLSPFMIQNIALKGFNWMGMIYSVKDYSTPS